MHNLNFTFGNHSPLYVGKQVRLILYSIIIFCCQKNCWHNSRKCARVRLDLTIRVFVSCSCFSRVVSCRVFFPLSIRVLVFHKNWHIFHAIHAILRYSCFRVVFIFLSVSCCIFCRILIIFSYRIKFIFISYLYHIAVSYSK